MKILMETSAKHYRPGHFTSSKFHLFESATDGLLKFEALCVLDRSPFEQYNVPIKTSYRRTSRHMITRIKYIV